MSTWPSWTPAENSRLMEMLERHHSYDEIAQTLGRTHRAVIGQASRLGITLTTANGYTAAHVGELLGLACSKRVGWWIRQGWLRGTLSTSRMGNGNLIFVEHDDLMAFLADERYWHLIEPTAIPDPALRDWAIEQRRGLTFLTTAEAGERLAMTHYAVNLAIRQGRIKAVRPGRANWLVRSDWCVLPPERPITPGRAVTDNDRAEIRRLWGTIPAEEIGRRLGIGDGAVRNAADRMGLPRLGRGYWTKPEHRHREWVRRPAMLEASPVEIPSRRQRRKAS